MTKAYEIMSLTWTLIYTSVIGFGILHNETWSVNIAMFFAFILGILSIFGYARVSKEVASYARMKRFSYKMATIIPDAYISLLLASTGHFILASLWLLTVWILINIFYLKEI